MPTTFSRLLLAATFALTTALAAPSTRPAAAQPLDPPNVLLIVTDDQRADTMSAMPRTRAWFADGGTRFTNAFTATPVCCPSRASIMTGRFAHNHRVYRNDDSSNLNHDATIQAGLDPTYHTAIVGKFLNEWDLTQSPPYFDRWALTRNGRYRDALFNIDGEIRPTDRYSTTVVRRQAIRFLNAFDADDATPWFLYLAPIAPHAPYEAERRFADASVRPWRGAPPDESDRTDKPRYVRLRSSSIAEGRPVRRQQLRTLMSVDLLVDRVMQELEELGEVNTLAFYLSDNGYLLGEHGSVEEKGMPYTPAVRIPLMWRWPGKVPPGTTDGRLVMNIDIAPTIFEEAAIAAPQQMDGESLFTSARDRILLESWGKDHPPEHQIPQWASIRTLTYQYVEYYRGDSRAGRELYDLVNDPHQFENLVRSETPPDTTALSALLAVDRECSGPSCP